MGWAKDEAEKAPIYTEAVDMLQRWEAGDADTLALWNTMNSWVYAGFNEDLQRLGVHFEKDYHESVYFTKKPRAGRTGEGTLQEGRWFCMGGPDRCRTGPESTPAQ